MLEKEIDVLKAKQESLDNQQKQQLQMINSAVSGDSTANSQTYGGNQRVKNFKNDKIVKVNDAGNENGEADRGYYVVIHSTREKDHAEKLVAKEKTKGTDAKYLYNKTRKWYYIYSHYYKSLKEALPKAYEQRDKGYQGSWVHIY